MSLDTTQFQNESAQQAEGRTYEIEDAQGKPYLCANGDPQTITTLGSYAPAVRRALDANVQRASKGFRVKLDALSNRIRVVQAAIIAWTLEVGGEAVPLNAANVEQIMRAAPWILDEQEVAMRAGEDFFAPDSKTS